MFGLVKLLRFLVFFIGSSYRVKFGHLFWSSKLASMPIWKLFTKNSFCTRKNKLGHVWEVTQTVCWMFFVTWGSAIVENWNGIDSNKFVLNQNWKGKGFVTVLSQPISQLLIWSLFSTVYSFIYKWWYYFRGRFHKLVCTLCQTVCAQRPTFDKLVVA